MLEELRTKKVLVQHLETVSTSEATYNVLQSFGVRIPIYSFYLLHCCFNHVLVKAIFQCPSCVGLLDSTISLSLLVSLKHGCTT